MAIWWRSGGKRENRRVHGQHGGFLVAKKRLLIMGQRALRPAGLVDPKDLPPET